jgi:hypothetical protein
MNRKIGLGLILTCVVLVALIVFVFYMRRDNGGGKFTLFLEPEEITVRIGEYRNLTLKIVSTGYEGDIVVSEPTYSWVGEEPQVNLEYQIFPSSDEPYARFVKAESNLTLTLRMRWIGSPATLPITLYLSIAAIGNYGRGNEFEVSSENSVKITIELAV